MRSGVSTMHLGQTSDEFKSRLGSRQQPLCFCVRATNPILGVGLRAFSRWIFPPVQRSQDRQVLKVDPATTVRAKDESEIGLRA